MNINMRWNKLSEKDVNRQVNHLNNMTLAIA